MRNLPPEVLAQIGKRTGLKVRQLLYITARRHDTGAVESIGIWNGDQVRDFVIGGETRIYYGAGDFIVFGELKQEQGVVIHTLTATASPVSPEMDKVIHQYQTRMARVQGHLAFFDPETDNLVADPWRFFKGWIDTLPVNRPAKNEAGSATINMVGNSRILTRKNGAKRSDENQRKRLETDRLLENVAITGTVITPWGEKSAGKIAFFTNGRAIINIGGMFLKK